MDIRCWFERLSWVTAFPRYAALNLKIVGYSGICKTQRLIVALYRELALLQLRTKWFWQCPLIFTFQRPRPAPRPLSEEPPSSTSVSVSQSGIPSDSHVGLNCRLIVSKPQYFCGLTEVDGHRKEHVCLCMRACMKFHPRICVFMLGRGDRGVCQGLKPPLGSLACIPSLKQWRRSAAAAEQGWISLQPGKLANLFCVDVKWCKWKT